MKVDRTNFILILIVIIGFCIIGFGIIQALYIHTGLITATESAHCMQIFSTIMNASQDNPTIRPLDPYEICKEGYVRLHFVESLRWAIVGGVIVIAAIITKKVFFK